MGSDFAYIGTRFIATEEANADQGYKQMLIESAADDIVYSSLFTGVQGNLESFWGLGEINSLDEYAAFSGLDYINKKVLDEDKAFEFKNFTELKLSEKPF